MAIKGQAINVTITAIDTSTGKRKTGDSTNIAVYLVKDGTAAARNDATAISETDATNCPGEYTVELDATDMNANTVVVTGKSSTANIEIVPVKIVTEVGKIAALQADTDDIQTRLPDALVGGNLKADVVAISGDTTAADNAELMFDGTGYAGGTTKLQTAVTSIATDAITADALKTDAITKIQAGLSTHSAADVKTAIEAAGSSIASILADTAELQTDWVNGGRLDLLIDAIKAKTDTYVVPPTTAEIKTALEIAGGTLALILADTGELQTDWVNGGRLDLLVDAIKAKTDTIPANPAQVGSAMTLADDAITAAKYDETTAFPVKSADTGTTQIARTGADADTLETLSDEIAGISGGAGLTAQDVRDAMMLAPTAGSPAAGSVDADLDDIQARLPAALVDGKMDAVASVVLSDEDIADMADSISTTIAATLGGQTITVVSPLIDSGTIQIVPGDTYNPDKANRLIRFTNTGSWSDLTNATVTIEWTGTGTATCEVAAAGGSTTEQIIDVPLSAANTAAIQEGPFKIYATWTSPADVETLVIGHIVISGDVD